MIADLSASETNVHVQQTSQCETPQEATNPTWQQHFMSLLPSIRRHANVRFRNLSHELREELVQETIARALLDYVRLVERGKEHVACASPLSRYAVAQVCGGRRVGGRHNVRDITSHYSQRRTGAVVERLDRCGEESGGWEQIVVEDRNAGPAEVASTRLDIRAWLKTLPKRDRRLAERLATGETTSSAARIFGISPGRVAQLRRELHDAWRSFQGEPVPAALD